MSEAKKIAEKLTGAEPAHLQTWIKKVEQLAALKRFRALCDDNCSIDWDTAEPCIDAGFVIERRVTKSDIAEPYAEERGIIKGGIMFEITPLGLAVARELEARDE